MRQILTALFFTVFALSQTLLATQPQKIKTFSALEKELKSLKLSKKDMVIFDVDMVLTMPRDPLLQVSTMRTYKKDFRRHLKSLTPKQQELAAFYQLLKSPQQPTDKKMSGLVKHISKQAQQIFLTGGLTGSFPRISNAAEWRVFSLASAGYTIEKYEKHLEIYKDFPKYLGSYPLRIGNLLMTNGVKGGTTKGTLLIHHLNNFHIAPTRIIMIDDRSEQLDSAQSHLEEHYPGIQFIGLHYTAAYKKQPTPHGYKNPTHKAFKKALAQLKKLAQKAEKPYKEK